LRRYAILAPIALAVVSAGWWVWRVRQNAPGPLLARIPAGATSVVGIDVAALRRTGLLDRIAGSRDLESPDYRKFIEETGVDYRRDLDYAVVGLHDNANYFALRGRFDWPTIERYALANRGFCGEGACRLQTDSGRQASFALVEPELLVLSVGPRGEGTKRFSPPEGIAWAVLDRPPAPLFDGASKVTIAIQANMNKVSARLVATCPEADRRPALAAKLQSALKELRLGPLAADFAKGIVKTTDTGVEVSWSLGPAERN
jgi:hypothetical protein